MVTPVSSLPSTSSAVNIQIIEPKNFPGGAVPGQMGPAASPFGAPQQGMATPYGDPQQQLQQAYQNAMNSRNQAEQARNQYLQMANQLNNQAYQQPPQNQFSQGFYPPGAMQQNPYAPGAYPGYFPQIQYPQYQQYPQQQFPQQPPVDPAAQQQQQQPPVDPAAQQQQQPPVDPAAQQQQQGLSGKSVEELNQMLASPQTLQEKVDAMEEIGVRGQATPETFGMLAQEALTDTNQLTGQAKDDANYVRQASLWTLGMLNKAQNAQVPTAQLPGLDAIKTIIANKNENDDVQAAAVQALQVIDRPNDKEIKKILKRSASWREKNPDVKRLAKDALSGKSIPLPGAAGAAPQAAGAPGADPMAAMGGDPMAALGGAQGGAAGGADPMAGLADLLGGGGGQAPGGAQGGGFDPSQLMQALGGGGQQA